MPQIVCFFQHFQHIHPTLPAAVVWPRPGVGVSVPLHAHVLPLRAPVLHEPCSPEQLLRARGAAPANPNAPRATKSIQAPHISSQQVLPENAVHASCPCPTQMAFEIILSERFGATASSHCLFTRAEVSKASADDCRRNQLPA